MAINFKPFEELFAPTYQLTYISTDGDINVGPNTYSVFHYYTMVERQQMFQVCAKHLPWGITQEQEQWERTMYMYQFIIKSPAPFPYKEYPLSKDITIKTYTDTIGHVAITIGDDRVSAGFKAHVKMEFWNKEENFTLEIPNVITVSSPIVKDGKVSLEEPLRGMDWYKDGDNLKWIFRLKSKPSTNKFLMQLGGGWEKFNFHRQTPYKNPETFERDGEEWLRIQPGRLPGSVEACRPRKVDGSYRVTHKTKRDHILGRTNYTTGQVCYFYVPKVTDAVGKSAWCELDVKDGIYTVTIPQKFLDEAVYPVIRNETFGITDIGANEETLLANNLFGFGPFSPAEDGSVTAISIWTRNNGNSLTLGIYDESASDPDSKLRDTGGGSSSGSPDWQEQALDSPLDVLAANSYWLAENGDFTVQINYGEEPGIRLVSDAGVGYVAGTLAASFGNLDDDFPVSLAAYAIYTPDVPPVGMAGAMTTNTGYWGY